VTQQRSQYRPDHGILSYSFAALGVLVSLVLGIATLALGPSPVEADAQQPSVSIEEAAAASSKVHQPPSVSEYDSRQANLVTSEDARIASVLGGFMPNSPPREVTTPGALPTLVLPGRAAPYDLSTLIGAGAVVTQPDGGLLLVHNVLAAPGAAVNLSLPGGALRMSSGPGGITSLVAFKGSLTVGGGPGNPLRVTSWDPTKNAPDTDPEDGRAYIREFAGRMDLHDMSTTDLGFWSGRTGGVAWTGSAAAAATGSARNVVFTGNHYGLFSSKTKDLLINGAQVKNSEMDGIAVHRQSDGTQLWQVTSSNNARNGIAVTQGAQNVSLRAVTATSNARNGIYLDGSPLATGPNAGGSATTASSGFTVAASTSRGNSEHGILVNTANNTELINNMVSSNRDGIVVRGVTHGVALRENHISAPGGFAVAIRDGSTDAVVDKNVISDAVTGVQVDNAVAKVSGNEIDDVGMHGVSIIGNGSGSAITDNRLSGRGPSAVDLNRLSFDNVVDVSGNDVKNWVVDRDDAQYLANFVRKHPLILLWFLTLFFPLAARLYFKRRANLRIIGGHPYDESAVALTAPVPPVAVRAVHAAASPRTASLAAKAPVLPDAGSTTEMTDPPRLPPEPGTSNDMATSNGSSRQQNGSSTRVTVVSEQ
jgi:parallel beta-helix repeat protein